MNITLQYYVDIICCIGFCVSVGISAFITLSTMFIRLHVHCAGSVVLTSAG